LGGSVRWLGSAVLGCRDYNRALGAVLKGKYPPMRALHGLLGGVTLFTTLAACLIGTWG
jgi:hypothetical protein